ncbi:hypothetical protein BDZ94DRAFT_908483 [Collybia nuda]|uniref:Uncharacterized protein n=1 Tax=Collybia nuda TaxID=64659 RepID=A0A9P6CIW0_9AGAR|nr:hypothetical protein BDZ94DRAFT_908483 [Collybia nuda]
MLSSLLITRAIGNADNGNSVFDDLKEVGLWPITETIGKIVKIKIWVGKTRIFAIETSYKLVNDDYHMTQMHGKRFGTKVEFDAARFSLVFLVQSVTTTTTQA